MSQLNRRDFLKAAGGSALALAGRVAAQGQPVAGLRARPRLPRGYLLVQDLATYNTSQFGAISTVAAAEAAFAQLDGKLNALEFASLYYGAHDLRAHEAVARVGVAHKVDLWATTFQFKFRSFGAPRTEFQAHVMEADGHIVPADRAKAGAAPDPVFDVLNPAAVEWLLGEYRKKYLERMQGLLAGLFFNEDCVPYLAPVANKRRFDYWRNATFSPRVLSLWRAYCQEHNIQSGGKLVNQFPVHDPKMVAQGDGLTAYFPGWNTPKTVEVGQRFSQLPRAEGVWRHWDDFVCGLYLQNWIGRLAQLANEVNRKESIWKGVAYFGLHYWSLPYEQIANPEFRVPAAHGWGAWGRQRGLDLQRLAIHPDVDILICETYPPMAANLEDFVAEYARITRAAGKTFGVMLHRDDKWALKPEEEQRRWATIAKYQPTLLARYPRKRMLPNDKFYNPELEKLFAERLAQYRRGGL